MQTIVLDRDLEVNFILERHLRVTSLQVVGCRTDKKSDYVSRGRALNTRVVDVLVENAVAVAVVWGRRKAAKQ